MKEIWDWKTYGLVMKETWETKSSRRETFRLGWSVFWWAMFFGGIPVALIIFWAEGRFWPISTHPLSYVSNAVWIGWGIMAEGISVRLAMKKWAGRLAP